MQMAGLFEVEFHAVHLAGFGRDGRIGGEGLGSGVSAGPKYTTTDIGLGYLNAVAKRPGQPLDSCRKAKGSVAEAVVVIGPAGTDAEGVYLAGGRLDGHHIDAEGLPVVKEGVFLSGHHHVRTHPAVTL